jgi:eukaryotic-like serine/threonine-protein kinase
LEFSSQTVSGVYNQPFMPLATGTRLGPYEIVIQVGAGGMGEVYSARDTRLDRIVAIKVLPSHRSDEVDARERFEREGRAIAVLNHPHICQLYDVGTQGPVHYLVLEFLEGETLADRLVRGPFLLNELLRYAQEVTDALDTAHRRGIIHRDLKPGNIFLTTHGESKVLDFGLAKLVAEAAPGAPTVTRSSPVTVAGTAVGTVAYMSPEQARGETLDERTDIFSLGAVLYEMATGRAAFQGKTSAVIFKAILDETPIAISQRNPILPERLNEIVDKALEKDRNLRYQSAAELRADLQRLKRDSESAKVGASASQQRSYKHWPGIAALVLVLLAVGIGTYRHLAHRAAPRSTAWEQLTFFTDSAVYPALSPDGRMLAFIRGGDSFLGPGDVYVRLLPSGDAVRLTHDSSFKLAPVFSPDGSRIAYSTVDPWDVLQVPVLGGQPTPMFKNASSLSWIESGKQLLFSELREGLHLVLVTTNEGRGQGRDVYVPPGNRSMVHHSYISPDSRWVLVVMMDTRGQLMPCQVVPFDGSGNARVVGPPHSICTSGAWSPDGKWIYVSSNQGGRFHIWRQKFPGGAPEQVTSGTTEEEGIAMSSDGESLLTSVGARDDTIWIHDATGDHQLSSEGSAFWTKFSSDGSKLYYLSQSGQNPGIDLWVRDLASGASELVASGSGIQPGSTVEDYSVSQDGKRAALSIKDEAGLIRLWMVSTDRRSSPHPLAGTTSEDSPWFLPNGDLLVRATEGGQNFLYRINPETGERHKITSEPVLDVYSVSPDGRWAVGSIKGPDDENFAVTTAFPIDGGPSVRLCNGYCQGRWDVSGKIFFMTFNAPKDSSTYALPVNPARGLPDFLAGGVRSAADLKGTKGMAPIPQEIESAAGPNYYSFSRHNTRRNIYRIPLPD